MISPYSQGDKNFQYLSRKRADDIFSSYKFYHDITNNNEIIFSNSKKLLDKYSNKKILIIGGGPSTNKFFDGEKDISKYDFLWSVNHFYLNKHLASLKIDLAMMMLEPNIFSDDFKKYYNNFTPTLGFELHDKWKATKIPYEDCFVMQTRFYGILGACQRMIIFASYLGASEIHFVGLDGLTAIRKGMHSFQPGKNKLPSISNDDVYSYQYQELWKYLYRFKGKIKYKNLSKV
jgi:hypothetical protein